MDLSGFFDRVVLISLARRPDRRALCEEQFARFAFPPVTIFEAHDMPKWENNGCTASHRGVLELICHHKWQRTLILEDDFKIRHDDFHARFEAMIGEVPDDWEMLYLGGHYAEKPLDRVSRHVIRMGRMMTTSSYAVTLDFARKIAPHIYGIGPIDTLYYGTHLNGRCYIFQPRLMVQREGFSEIQQKHLNYEPCMEDTRHEEMV